MKSYLQVIFFFLLTKYGCQYNMILRVQIQEKINRKAYQSHTFKKSEHLKMLQADLFCLLYLPKLACKLLPVYSYVTFLPTEKYLESEEYLNVTYICIHIDQHIVAMVPKREHSDFTNWQDFGFA